jgi:large subunit ribosomal protein L13
MQLMGKDRPTYTAHQLTGAHVVVVNAQGARLSGKKNEQKVYMSYSGYAGGLKTTTLEQVRENRPIDIVRESVRRMLPKNRIGREMLRNLKVYSGPDHPHKAQAPDNKVEATL